MVCPFILVIILYYMLLPLILALIFYCLVFIISHLLYGALMHMSYCCFCTAKAGVFTETVTLWLYIYELDILGSLSMYASVRCINVQGIGIEIHTTAKRKPAAEVREPVTCRTASVWANADRSFKFLSTPTPPNSDTPTPSHLTTNSTN